MKKTLSLLLILLILLSCTKEREPTDPQGGKNGEKSLFEAANWDGEKRGEVFYEIFVRSFADSDGDGIGDIGGITQKLDYLNDLGISGIWLTPIHPSPSYHGYDVDDFMSIDPKYGTMAQFEAMISKASSLKIKVILDLVINHTSKNHPWFKSAILSTDNSFRNWYLFAPSDNVPGWISSGMVPMTNSYYSGHWHSISSGTTGFKYMGMFSDWMPDLNYGEISQAENSPAFKEMVKTAEFWLSKGVYGFRLDAVKHIYQSEDSDENPRFLEKFYNEVKKKESKVYMVGENLTGDYNKVAPYYKGLPALFNFDAWYKLIYVIENSHAKWYPKDIKEMETKFRSVRGDAINATKLSNHDEDRTMSRLNNDISKAKIAASILLTVSGSPYLYYGEEIGMRGMKGSDDRNVREPFLWSPYSTDTYRTKWHTPLNSTEPTVMPVSLQQENKESILNHYKRLIKLRNTYPSLAKGSIDVPQSFDIYPKQIMAFYRELQGERLLVVHNVSSSISTYIIDHSFKKGVAEFGGVTYVKINESTYSVTMPAYSSVIFEL
jgi:glycosidase